MPSEHTRILEVHQYKNPDKALFINNTDLECLIEKIDGCKINHENSSATIVGEHITSSFSMIAISSLKSIENKHGVYRDKDCMENFCKSLGEHALKIISLKKKKMKQNKQQNLYQNPKICYICKGNFEDKHAPDKENIAML